MTKEPNYTPKMEAVLRAEYLANPSKETVDILAAMLGKKPRSVTAKLSNMGIYQTPARTSKSGKPIIKKQNLVEQIEGKLNLNLPSLIKANKKDLERIVEHLLQS